MLCLACNRGHAFGRGEAHMHRYLAEFEFRYNFRIANGCDDRGRANNALAGIVGKRLTYARPDQHT